MKNYSIRESVEKLFKEYKNPQMIGAVLWKDIQANYPPNKGILLPGKLYVLGYKKESKKLYDMRPYILCFGACDNADPTIVYGLAWHYIPQNIRWRLGEYIFEMFAGKISAEIGKYPDIADAPKQDYIKDCIKETVVPALKRVNLTGAIHKYDMKNMTYCYAINYNRFHWILCDESNTFANGTIADAQKSFLEKMARPTKK